MYRQSLVCRPVFSLVRLLVRPWPYRVAPAAGESFGAHICPIPWSSNKMSQHSQHQSAARIRVPSGPFGLAEQGLLFEHFFCISKIFRQGGNAWNLFDFYNQSSAIVCVDTIKYYSIPSVPSGFEGVKRRPQPTSSQRRSK